MTRKRVEEIIKKKILLSATEKPSRKNFSAYIPPEMLEALKQDAKDNMRSANA